MENGNINVTLVDGKPLPFIRNYTLNITACNVKGCTPYEGNITISEWLYNLVDNCNVVSGYKIQVHMIILNSVIELYYYYMPYN